MDVTIRTEKTYLVAMTETQARNLLTIGTRADELENELTLDEITTLDEVRQALLYVGLTKDPG